jgi:hypothetical protein
MFWMTDLPEGFLDINAFLILAEVIALTAIAIVAFYLLKREKPITRDLQGPF